MVLVFYVIISSECFAFQDPFFLIQVPSCLPIAPAEIFTDVFDDLIGSRLDRFIGGVDDCESCERIGFAELRGLFGFAELRGLFGFAELRNSFPRSLLRGESIYP